MSAVLWDDASAVVWDNAAPVEWDDVAVTLTGTVTGLSTASSSLVVAYRLTGTVPAASSTSLTALGSSGFSGTVTAQSTAVTVAYLNDQAGNPITDENGSPLLTGLPDLVAVLALTGLWVAASSSTSGSFADTPPGTPPPEPAPVFTPRTRPAFQSPWRFLLFDAVTREPQAEIAAVGSLTYGEELNLPGSLKAAVQLVQPAGSPVTMEMLKPPRAVIAVERDDVLLWAGPIWAHDYDLAGGTLSVSAEGYLSYLRRRILRTTTVYLQADQALIAKQLIDYTQALAGGNLGIDTTSLYEATGRLRDRTYPAHERKRIGTLIEQLAAVRDGFDFRLVPRWSDGPNSLLVVDFDLQYPNTGRETGLVFDLGATVEIPNATLDGTMLAYKVDAIGQGTGDVTPIETVTDSQLIADNLLLEDDVSASDVSETDTLLGKAQRRLDRGRVPIIIPKVVVGVSDVSAFKVGDQVLLRADHGLFQIPGHKYRVTGYQADLSNEQVQVSLAPQELFDAS